MNTIPTESLKPSPWLQRHVQLVKKLGPGEIKSHLQAKEFLQSNMAFDSCFPEFIRELKLSIAANPALTYNEDSTLPVVASAVGELNAFLEGKISTERIDMCEYRTNIFSTISGYFDPKTLDLVQGVHNTYVPFVALKKLIQSLVKLNPNELWLKINAFGDEEFKRVGRNYHILGYPELFQDFLIERTREYI